MAEQRPDGQCWCPVWIKNRRKRRCLGIAPDGKLHCYRDVHKSQYLTAAELELDKRYLKAASDGNWERMNTILTEYPGVSSEEADQLAIRKGHLTIVKNLIRNKKHYMNISDMCLYAIQFGNIDMVQIVVQQGKPTMELVSRMVIKAAETANLNVIQYLWTFPEFKMAIRKAESEDSYRYNILMISSFLYNFEMTRWILENIPFDIEKKDGFGTNVLEKIVMSEYDEHFNYKREEITPYHFYKMVTLLVTVGNADAAEAWEFLVYKWSQELSELEPGEDEMIKQFIKTLYLFKQPSKSIEDGLRATRYAYLVDEVEKVRLKVYERKNSLSNLVGEHLLPDLTNVILDMEHLTTDEMWDL
jgi:hypothetical protein